MFVRKRNQSIITIILLIFVPVTYSILSPRINHDQLEVMFYVDQGFSYISHEYGMYDLVYDVDTNKTEVKLYLDFDIHIRNPTNSEKTLSTETNENCIESPFSLNTTFFYFEHKDGAIIEKSPIEGIHFPISPFDGCLDKENEYVLERGSTWVSESYSGSFDISGNYSKLYAMMFFEFYLSETPEVFDTGTLFFNRDYAFYSRNQEIDSIANPHEFPPEWGEKSFSFNIIIIIIEITIIMINISYVGLSWWKAVLIQ